MCKTDKESYIKYWDDISPFIKFGCLKDEKFCDKMSDYILFKNIDHDYLTLKECIEKNSPAKEVAEENTFHRKPQRKILLITLTTMQMQKNLKKVTI